MEPARGGVLGAALRDPQLVVLSGHFPHVETEAQVGAEPGVQARECALPGPGSWGSGAPRWGTLREPGPRCALRSWGGPSPTALATSPGAPGDLLGQPLFSSVGHHGSLAVPPGARDPPRPGPVRGAGEPRRGGVPDWWPLRMRC